MTKKPTKKDLEDQLSKALDEVIALKEERNKLKEEHAKHLFVVNYIASKAEYAIYVIRLSANTAHVKSLFGNSFALQVAKDVQLQDAYTRLKDLALETKQQ